MTDKTILILGGDNRSLYLGEYLEKTPYLQVNAYHRDFKDSWNKQIALYDMAGISTPIYPAVS